MTDDGGTVRPIRPGVPPKAERVLRDVSAMDFEGDSLAGVLAQAAMWATALRDPINPDGVSIQTTPDGTLRFTVCYEQALGGPPECRLS